MTLGRGPHVGGAAHGGAQLGRLGLVALGLEAVGLASANVVNGVVGDRLDQPAGVFLLGVGVDRLGGAVLDDLAGVHDRHGVANELHHREVVADEHVGEAELLLEVHHEVNDLSLDRDVEGRDRLVAHDELRVEGQGPRDGDPLSLSTRELVRVAAHVDRVEAALLQQPHRAVASALLVPVEPVDGHGLREHVSHGHARVERGVGVLEDDLHPAAQLAERERVRLAHVDPVEADLAFDHEPVAGLDQAQERAAGGRLAAARLAYQPDRLPGPDLEGHAVYGSHVVDDLAEEAASHREVDLEVLDLEERLPGRVDQLVAAREL